MERYLELMNTALTDKQFASYLKEAIDSVEDELAQEDKNWINLSTNIAGGVQTNVRIQAVKDARLSFYTDPMSKQAIRLWTDYSFGEGMTWKAEEKETETIMSEKFFDLAANQVVLGARGQRKSSDKLLVDGEIFFALFIAGDGAVTLRTIDPLEITEIITDPGDIDTPLFYKREWSDVTGKQHTSIYRSTINEAAKMAPDSSGQNVKHNDEALVYHLPLNTLSQRGVPLLLPAQFYVKYQKKFMAARISIMLALTRFAWKTKVQGGATQVAAAKATLQDKIPAAGSNWIENQALSMEPIKVDTGSGQAYQDGRMIKLQICSAVGWPEQYFGDLATGNLATAKTVELPVQKMCSSYQKIWADAYKDICEVVFRHNDIPEDKWYVDLDFPAIAPQDAVASAQTMQALATVFPSFSDSKDIMQAALVSMGINDPTKVIEGLEKLKAEEEKKKEERIADMPPEMKAQMDKVKQSESITAKLINSLKEFKAIVVQGGNSDHEVR